MPYGRFATTWKACAAGTIARVGLHDGHSGAGEPAAQRRGRGCSSIASAALRANQWQ
jgi:hypothetical protein